MGTAVLDFFVFIEKMKAITGQFLLLSTSEFSSLPVFIPILLLFLTLMIEKKKSLLLAKSNFILMPWIPFPAPSENTASTVTVFLLYHRFLPLLGH